MSRFEIKEELREDGIRIVSPEGKLDVFSFMELRKYFEDLAAEGKAMMVVVDLKGVDFIASSGWSVLLSRRSAFRRLGGDLTVCGMTENIRRVYDTMKINEMLPVADDVEGGIKILSAPEAV
jgi:anti-anti-sigma factor